MPWQTVRDPNGAPTHEVELNAAGQPTGRTRAVTLGDIGPGAAPQVAPSGQTPGINPSAPAPSHYNPHDPFGIGSFLRERIGSSIWGRGWGQALGGRAQASPTGETQQAPSGSTAGTAVGQYQPIFDPNEEIQPSPTDQRILDALAEVSAGLQPAERLEPLPVTPDPSIAQLVALAQRRQDLLAPIIEEQIANIRSERARHEGRTNLQQFGEWISRWAASGDPGYGGQALLDMRERTAAREREWTDQVLRLTEAGFSLEEAVGRANAAVASEAHRAEQTTGERRYESAREAAEAQDRLLPLRAQLGVSQAEQLAAALARSLEQQQQGAQALLQTPGGEAAGAGEIGRLAFPSNSRAAQVLGRGLASDQRLSRVAQRLAGPYARRRDFRDLRRDARRIDPSLTDADIQRLAQMLSAQPAE